MARHLLSETTGQELIPEEHPIQIQLILTAGIRDDDTVSKLDFLKVITKPLTKTIISIEKSTIKDIAKVSTWYNLVRYVCL